MKFTDPSRGQRPFSVVQFDLMLFGGLLHLLATEEVAPADPIATDARRFRLIREVQAEVIATLPAVRLCVKTRPPFTEPVHGWSQVQFAIEREAPAFLAALCQPCPTCFRLGAPLAAALTTAYISTLHLAVMHGTGGPAWKDVTAQADTTINLARSIRSGAIEQAIGG